MWTYHNTVFLMTWSFDQLTLHFCLASSLLPFISVSTWFSSTCRYTYVKCNHIHCKHLIVCIYKVNKKIDDWIITNATYSNLGVKKSRKLFHKLYKNVNMTRFSRLVLTGYYAFNCIWSLVINDLDPFIDFSYLKFILLQ